jgi:tetratricopeptide (TPR) repeat protein
VPKRLTLILAGCLLAAVTLAYSNHFDNAFHFDDFHTVTDNPYIRSLGNIPKFFTNAETFSTLSSNRSYRPLISTSLALDYWAGSGLRPFFFHLSTFLWYLLQLTLMFLLFRRIFDAAMPDPRNAYFAFFAAAWYGVHPAIAETVNYIIQRGDLLSTLAVIAALYLYIASPAARRYHLYLIPAALAPLCKPPALIFPFILLAYILLFEERRMAFRKCIPAILVSVCVAILQAKMTPPSYVAGASSAYGYRITQPFVALHYFVSFFLPLQLTADTDRMPLETIFSLEAIGGFVFVAAVLFAAILCSRRRDRAPIAFGLFWFLLALLPTSVFALAEVENDHRMYFPFVGLVISGVWAVALALPRRANVLRAAAGIAAVILCLYGWGAYRRNQVWRTEESLWRDVTQKSPKNGRGLMNYGLTQMAKGEYPAALGYFERAVVYNPAYPFLEVNLGIANGALARDGEAERHFRRAIELAPGDAQVHFYYGRWLRSKNRGPVAISELRIAAMMNPSYLDPRYLLIQADAEQQDWPEVKRIAGEIQRLAPGDATAASYLKATETGQSTPEAYLQLSLRYHQAGKYKECIDAARQALRLRPDYAEAYNNIAAAYESMNMWDEAIEAAKTALKINPNYQLAQNNLAWSESQKNRAK